MKALALALLFLQASPSADPAAELAPGVELLNTRRMGEGRLEKAKAFFESYLASHPGSAPATFYLGRVYLEMGQGEKAADWLEKAIGLDRDNSELHVWLARAYGVAASKANPVARNTYAREAKVALEKAVRLDPKNVRAREDLIKFYLSAPEFLGGSVASARREAEATRKIDPVSGRMLLATIHLHEKLPDAAELEYQAAIREAPTDLRPRMALGYLHQSLSRWTEAFDAFEGILSINPEVWDAMYQLGRTGAFSGQRLDRSEEVLKKYIGHTHEGDGPPISGAHFRLGMIYEKKGDPARAREHYRKSLELDPANEDVRKALERLPGS
ncbi:MAG TPA: tetratricopeptide repeat protein [Thermoanaerobaculia bacterium]|nr:tetratricopeptide repeat protein [Thermoanaerobaculia bacterium]